MLTNPVGPQLGVQTEVLTGEFPQSVASLLWRLKRSAAKRPAATKAEEVNLMGKKSHGFPRLESLTEF